ncbi:MAG: D-amino acid aminotransferase [Bacillota bacterium]|nr:D-amino acid aminotransferase [Bacillota bacterium]
MSETVFLNGQFVPYEQALIPVEDRGFLFGDGIYEVVAAYGGRFWRMEEHLDRLERSALAIHLPLPMEREAIRRTAEELLRRNGLERSDASLYLEVTRGPAPRNHLFPEEPHPTVVMIARPLPPVDPAVVRDGVTAITVPDIRWQSVHIKSVCLLPNVLAKQAAHEAGAFEAILVREGVLTEGSSSNLFLVFGQELHTHPEGPFILSGVTRGAVIEVARDLGYPVVERAVPLEELWRADEVFVTGTTSEVVPVVRVDDRLVGSGRPGPVVLRLLQELRRRTRGEA